MTTMKTAAEEAYDYGYEDGLNGNYANSGRVRVEQRGDYKRGNDTANEEMRESRIAQWEAENK